MSTSGTQGSKEKAVLLSRDEMKQERIIGLRAQGRPHSRIVRGHGYPRAAASLEPQPGVLSPAQALTPSA